MRRQNGFTLIELLVVIAVIALVGTFAAVAVNAARSKQRDATRISNVRQVQSALEDYFNETNMYPVGEALPLGDASQSGCLSNEGFGADCTGHDSVFLRIIPASIPNGLKGRVACGTPPRNAACYTATLEQSAYKIEFELENALPQVGLIKGVNCASPEGMEGGACE